MIFVACIIVLQNTTLIFKAPEKRHLFTSLLDDFELEKSQHHKLLKSGMILAQLWIWITIWAFSFFQGFQFLAYSYATHAALKKLK